MKDYIKKFGLVILTILGSIMPSMIIGFGIGIIVGFLTFGFSAGYDLVYWFMLAKWNS